MRNKFDIDGEKVEILMMLFNSCNIFELRAIKRLLLKYRKDELKQLRDE